jgi:predicted RNase H-like HicB family nuclease
MEAAQEVEFVFEPQPEGGYHVYASELPGLHAQGDTLEEGTESAREALELYVEGLREDGRSLEMGIVRRFGVRCRCPRERASARSYPASS